MPGFSHFIIAAPHSGAGKTTVTLGLLRALNNRGLNIQPFKCGPDFIDPLHHSAAANTPGINLDLYMMSPAHIRELYQRNTRKADVAITEGVMGLFDGAQKREGSSADLAALLQLPVILILNAKAMAYSAAALLYGLKNFDPALRIAGVIFNFVDTATHYQLLKEACDDVGIPALGHLPANKHLHIPSRHLGLDTANAEDAIQAAARHIEEHLDLDAILAATRTSRPAPAGNSASSEPKAQPTAPANPGKKTILVARDAAFLFLYPENLRRLETYGRIIFFSPLKDTHLPPADILYLPGGYPELYLDQLSNNQSLWHDIRTFAANGGRILAECGGMMVLGHSIIDESGKTWPTAGLVDIATTIKDKKLTLGYRTLTLNNQILKGHEFHYSQFTNNPTGTKNIAIHNARGQEIPAPVFYRQNLFASYMHFYWGESPGPLEAWLEG
ncbi:MAG TPA: cobyrinate a,c-diamide synthase [Puia sp.]|uniref:cobyrinate a,c-diamide synthase n=1 Tax=Puia sp. TaxID=2045100 RepID=UPI002BC735A6|nr:cobyrinate a,c-diamide synthase [Puia sp.]HVU94583.1 cobyrinate a,c-diamide synthase [Puia sp.]